MNKKETTAYMQGVNAYSAKTGKNSNPYNPETLESVYWKEGYDSAKKLVHAKAYGG